MVLRSIHVIILFRYMEVQKQKKISDKIKERKVFGSEASKVE